MRVKTTDLTKRPPRSPRVRLGGYVILPRMLDKGRALVAGKNGEYNFNCPVDNRFLEFVGLEAEPIKQLLVEGKGDLEILEWIQANAPKKHSPDEIEAWSTAAEKRQPEDEDSRKFFEDRLKKLNPKRTDVVAWFDLLDLDDYVSFGGKP